MFDISNLACDRYLILTSGNCLLEYGGRDVRININDINIINIYDFSLISMMRTFIDAIWLRIDIYILCLMATVSKRAGKSKQLSAKRLGQRLWNSASFSLSHWIMAPFRLVAAS